MLFMIFFRNGIFYIIGSIFFLLIMAYTEPRMLVYRRNRVKKKEYYSYSFITTAAYLIICLISGVFMPAVALTLYFVRVAVAVDKYNKISAGALNQKSIMWTVILTHLILNFAAYIMIAFYEFLVRGLAL